MFLTFSLLLEEITNNNKLYKGIRCPLRRNVYQGLTPIKEKTSPKKGHLTGYGQLTSLENTPILGVLLLRAAMSLQLRI